MKRSVIIFTSLLLLLTGVGAAIYLLHSDEGDLVVPENIPVEEPTQSHKNDGTNVQRLDILDVHGTAQRRQPSGGWLPLKQGEQLTQEDFVRTKGESKLVLGLGENSTIELQERSSVEVRELSGAVQRLGLVEGKASVDYNSKGERTLSLENKEGSVVAKVREGKFSVLNSGKLLAVATTSGQVDLSAAGETVQVGKGEQSIVVGDAAPTRPVKSSVATWLKITDGSCRLNDAGKAVVRGGVSAGSTVKINNMDVNVSDSGTFLTYINLKKSKKAVTLKIRNIWGKEKSLVLRCVQSKPQTSIKKVNIQWGKRN